MEPNEKLDALAEIFDRDVSELRADRPLDELGWDSMTMLSLIAFARTNLNRKLQGAQLRAMKTVQDILNALD